MHKRIYKVIILSAIFLASLVFMGQNIKEEEITLKSAVEMGKAQFPLLYVGIGGREVNRLHGYSSNIDANVIRECVTPLDQEKTMEVRFREDGLAIRKIAYEVRELKENQLLDSGSISALDQAEGGKSARIKIEEPLSTSKEYAMKITASTESSKKIHYYTRIKYYDTDSYFDEKLAFVEEFHEKSMDKGRAGELARYLEADPSADNSSFAKVDIHSSLENLSFGELEPKALTELVPTVKEYNMETASIQLSYYASAKTDSGEELYAVTEFYRIRYTAERIYLLNYERTMESLFDVGLTSLSKSELKVGVTSDTGMDLVTSGENRKLAFVRQNALWYYDLEKNSAVRVFSFLGEGKDYLREGYDQHSIRILGMDEEGSIDFLVYGYMNRGDYEGKVALVLYRFYPDSDEIEELVYIPLEMPYQMLKEDVKGFSYVSQDGTFYFTVHSTLYSYDIMAKRLEEVVTGISEKNFAVMEEGESHAVAWIGEEDGREVLTILNAETGQRTRMEAGKKETLQIYGSIDDCLLYGYVRKKDIAETTEGTVILPAYRLEIADSEGSLLKTYKKKGAYIVDVEIEDNIAQLTRARKSGDGYAEISPDSILNRGDDDPEIITMEERVTERMKTEWYISLPDGFAITALPKMSVTSNAILKDDTTLYLDLEEKEGERYYIYGYGRILDELDDVVEAIQMADENFGVVVNGDNRLVWERGNKFNHKTLGQIQKIQVTESVDSVGASLSMLLHYNHIDSDAEELTKEGKSIYNVLSENLPSPVNLTGCTLDEALYFVSSGSPVIAMKDDSHAVLITGYDEGTVTVLDPQGDLSKLSLGAGSKLFEGAGNIFISYIN